MSVIDDYIGGFEGLPRQRLEQLCRILREEVPETDEVISYAIPTFDLNGRHVIHFAGYKNHVGLYPTPHGMAAFEAELAAFPQGKGSVQFPHDRPLPEDLIRRIARHQRALTASRPAKRKPRTPGQD